MRGQVLGLGGQVLGFGLGGQVFGLGLGGQGVGLDPSGLGLGICGLDCKSARCTSGKRGGRGSVTIMCNNLPPLFKANIFIANSMPLSSLLKTIKMQVTVLY